MIKILDNLFQNMNCFSLIKLTSVLIHPNIYTAIPQPELSFLPHHLCQIFPWSAKLSLQRNLRDVFYLFPYLFLSHLTTGHNYWIYQTISQAKTIKFITKLYASHNTLLVKHATCWKSDFLRAASLSKLDNTVNIYSVFNTKHPEFSTRR